MPDPYWGALKKSVSDSHTIDQEIDIKLAGNNPPPRATTWGMLPFSQISNQLISEYITAQIAAHEADPTAHLGAGESLEQHKSNEVLDHPEGAVVADKFQNFGMMLQDNLTYIQDGMGGWRSAVSASGYYDRYGIFGVVLGVDDENNGYAQLRSDSDFIENFIDYSKNWMFETSVENNLDGDFSSVVSCGYVQSSGAPNVLNNGVSWVMTQASTKVRWKDSTHDIYSAELGALDDNFHTLRLRYDPTLDQLFCYIDGVLVATLNDPGMVPTQSMTSFLFLMTALEAGTSSTLKIGYVKITHD